jgi:predicted transcriptional regulator
MEKIIRDKSKVEDKSNDNSNFVQLSRGYMSQMRVLSRKSPVAMQIFLYLVEHMGRTTNAVVCSYRVLSEVTNLSRTSVAKAIKILKEENWIDAVKIGNATAYAINERVVWQAGRNERKYAIFSATIIASESEQDSNYHELAKTKLTHIPIIESGDIATIGSEKLPPPDQQDLDI